WDAHETGSGIIGLTSWATITDLSSGTVLATSPQFQANVNDTWKLNSWLAGVFDAGNYRLTLRLGGEAVYDDVRLTAAAIPEPSGGILMLLGAAVSLIARRLGRRAKALPRNDFPAAKFPGFQHPVGATRLVQAAGIRGAVSA